MKKEKTAFYEEMQFSDASYATSIKEKTERRLNVIKIGMIVAAVATLCTVMAFLIPAASWTLISIAFVGAIISYILGGGFLIALKAAIKVAKFGWYITPFPIDIVTGLIAVWIAIWGFFFIPLIFVFLNYRQCKMDYDAATEYLRYNK